MKTLIAGREEVRAWLTMEDAVEVLETLFGTMHETTTILPLRTRMLLPDPDQGLAMMPAYLDPPGVVGGKFFTIFPGNHAFGRDAHQGAVLLFGVQHGELLAVLDASSLTAIRTAAVSGVATRYMARPDAHRLALLGSGVQAEAHLDAMRAVRAIDQVTVWSRHRSHAEAFRDRQQERTGVAIRVSSSASEAVADADIICTVTAAQTPVLEGRWLMPGVHMNAVGASVREYRELDSSAVAMSRCVVDLRESALHESGDILIPIEEGRVGRDHVVAELSDLVRGDTLGRVQSSDVTLFKSLGIASEDLAVAHHLYQWARDRGFGTWVNFG